MKDSNHQTRTPGRTLWRLAGIRCLERGQDRGAGRLPKGNKSITTFWLPRLLVAVLPVVAPAAWAEKFTIAVIPDTQTYTIYDAYMPGFTRQMQYIATNKGPRNIVFVSHLGDVVNDGGRIPAEWPRALGAMDLLRDSGIPFGVAIGNHDYDNDSAPVNGTTYWSQYFGPDSPYFQGKSWYHGYSNNVTDSYQIFHAAGRDFLHLVLELEPSADSLQWANQVIQAHPGMPTIVSIHQYLTYAGNRSGNNYRGGSTGLQVWNNLISPNTQIFMVLCGHSFSGSEGEVNHTTLDAAGKPVYEELTDYQGTVDGWMRLMEFDSALQQINFTTYSPLLDAWATDATSQFQVNFDWNNRFGPAPSGMVSLDSPLLSNGCFSVLLVGAAGQKCDLLASTNLADWVTVATLTNTNGSACYRETSPAGSPRRYYRARLLQ